MRLSRAIVGVCLIGIVVGEAARAVGAEKPSTEVKPPWQRLLQGKDAQKAEELESQMWKLQEAGQFDEALKVDESLVELRQKVQGADHWQTENARQAREAIRRVLRQGKEIRKEYGGVLPLFRQAEALEKKAQYKEAQPLREKILATICKVLGEEHPNTATGYNNVAHNQNAQGKYREAEEGFGKALAIYRKVLGEEHPDTATGYDNVANNQNAQGKYREAEEGYRKALAIRRKVLGEEHPDTALSYNNVAYNLNARGKYAEARPLFQKALAIRRKVLGEEHPDTALSYNNLALNQNARGKYAEAEQHYRQALAIYRKVLGEEHPSTATSYHNLAYTLNAQGKYADAEPLYAKALAISRKVLGEDHPDTARTCKNIADNLAHQGKYADAEPLYRQALAIFRKVQGEEHFSTASCYSSIASNLNAQGKYADAEPLYRQALAICRKVLGEEHPHTATCYSSIAYNLRDQGKYTEAESLFGKALAISRKVLGDEHPNTARDYNNVAYNLVAQGKYAEAEDSWCHAAVAFAKARLHIAASGLERAMKTGERSPLPRLAAALARNGKPDEAWQRFEESLGRGTWDDLSVRRSRSPAEQAQQAQLVARLSRLDRLIEKTVSVKEATAEQKRRREEMLTQLRQTQDELVVFAGQLEKKYGPAAGQLFPHDKIQAALPPDTALIAWLDIAGQPKAHDPNGEHWAILLRSAGPPLWVRLRGSGPEDAWNDDDSGLPVQLRAALQSSAGKWQPLAQRLRKQRLDPLRKHLDGVKHLLVLPSTALAGVPVEVFAGEYTIGYALSGTMYAHLRQQPKPTSKGLLAVADPVFDAPADAPRQEPLPPGGILLTMVAPKSNAARAGLRPNDVLLRYRDSELSSLADLQTQTKANDSDKPVSVLVWRGGKTFERTLQPGRLGVVVANDPAPKALAELRKLDRKLVSLSRGGDWQPLPGTRIEVEGLRRLFVEPTPTLLVDSSASEQRLNELAHKGELGKYRYLHLATHGEVDNVFPLRSAVILSRDKLPDALKQLQEGKPVFDGRLTAEEVLRQWHLHSELVTLSACQTALGRHEGGEGFVGFAQALILSGSRSVCLSLWKVDDAATALLMERFYQNLLGRRSGLKEPLAKAAALTEAKAWLRDLPREQALKRAAALSKGVERGKGRPVLPLLPPEPLAGSKERDKKPYAHPYYWAAFVLIGDRE